MTSKKSVKTRFWLGDAAGPISKKDVKGIVVGMLVSLGDAVSYKVAWVHDGERKTNWFEECELCGADDMPETIGFVAKQT